MATPDQKTKPDPVSALYIDKSPEQLEADERLIKFFIWLLNHRAPDELLQ